MYTIINKYYMLSKVVSITLSPVIFLQFISLLNVLKSKFCSFYIYMGWEGVKCTYTSVLCTTNIKSNPP